MTIAAPREKIKMISESLYIAASKDHIHQGSGVHFQVFWLRGKKRGKKKETKKASTVWYLGDVRSPRLLPGHESEGNNLALVMSVVISIAFALSVWCWLGKLFKFLWKVGDHSQLCAVLLTSMLFWRKVLKWHSTINTQLLFNYFRDLR